MYTRPSVSLSAFFYCLDELVVQREGPPTEPGHCCLPAFLAVTNAISSFSEHLGKVAMLF